ncbi:hypothetical protein M0R45_032309 [Rubus argutus]|uniref:Uncharacterized protein n=1 Tax=Rubus argutus TaxID=59490 RepID=A0AAW1WKQ3_RUBAR
MLIYGPTPILLNRTSTNTKNTNGIIIRSTYQLAIASRRCIVATAGLVTAATVLASAATVGLAIEAPEQGETLANIPQTLSGECILPNDCKKARIQKPKSRKAESCTIKCVTTCIRGGEGSPGEGPFNVRRPIVVFKQGFRSRQYCLVECSDICNLIRDGDDGP